MSYSVERSHERVTSLCRLRTGDGLFGIETSAVREELDRYELREIPRAPKFVAGVLAYRGEVLLAVSFRALLGIAPGVEASVAVVLRDTETGELFALLVDALLDVAAVADSAWEPNPATLDERSGLLFSGIYRTPDAPLVWLKPQHLQPSWLMKHIDSALQIGEWR